jgi:hypothetical protein
MPDHIDLFEKICGQITSSGRSVTVTDEEKLNWFLNSVHEETYASIKAHYNSLKILGTLQFGQMIKLYALTCFAKYPQFQLRALGHKDAPLTNNSFTLEKWGRKGKADKSKGKGSGGAMAKNTVHRRNRNEDGSSHKTKHMKPKRQKTSRLIIPTRNGTQHKRKKHITRPVYTSRH